MVKAQMRSVNHKIPPSIAARSAASTRAASTRSRGAARRDDFRDSTGAVAGRSAGSGAQTGSADATSKRRPCSAPPDFADDSAENADAVRGATGDGPADPESGARRRTASGGRVGGTSISGTSAPLTFDSDGNSGGGKPRTNNGNSAVVVGARAGIGRGNGGSMSGGSAKATAADPDDDDRRSAEEG